MKKVMMTDVFLECMVRTYRIVVAFSFHIFHIE